MLLYIIYIETDILLSKRQYGSWREIQDEYQNYKASLGPWSVQEVIEFLSDEYPKICPSAQQQVQSLIFDTHDVKTIAFLAD